MAPQPPAASTASIDARLEKISASQSGLWRAVFNRRTVAGVAGAALCGPGLGLGRTGVVAGFCVARWVFSKTEQYVPFTKRRHIVLIPSVAGEQYARPCIARLSVCLHMPTRVCCQRCPPPTTPRILPCTAFACMHAEGMLGAHLYETFLIDQHKKVCGWLPACLPLPAWLPGRCKASMRCRCPSHCARPLPPPSMLPPTKRTSGNTGHPAGRIPPRHQAGDWCGAAADRCSQPGPRRRYGNCAFVMAVCLCVSAD